MSLRRHRRHRDIATTSTAIFTWSLQRFAVVLRPTNEMVKFRETKRPKWSGANSRRRWCVICFLITLYIHTLDLIYICICERKTRMSLWWKVCYVMLCYTTAVMITVGNTDLVIITVPFCITLLIVNELPLGDLYICGYHKSILKSPVILNRPTAWIRLQSYGIWLASINITALSIQQILQECYKYRCQPTNSKIDNIIQMHLVAPYIPSL